MYLLENACSGYAYGTRSCNTRRCAAFNLTNGSGGNLPAINQVCFLFV
jgi:hypothetical protein